MLSVLFLPSLLYVAFQSSSMALGLIISLMILIVLVNKKKIPKTRNKFLYLFLVFFLLQYVYLILNDTIITSEKQIMSLFVLGLMIISAAFFSIEVKKIPDEKMIFFLKWLSILIIIMGFLPQVITINFAHYSDYVKAVFPYSEPSHYILGTGSILFAAGFFVGSIQRIVLVLLLMILTIVLPSTLALFLFIIMLVTYYTADIKKVVILGLLSIIIFLFVGNNIENLSYFSDRLNIASDNHNLTFLVYVQGIDDAYQSLIVTNGIGLGFQNMGSLPPSDISNLIYSLTGYYKNRNDGGFLAAKIIAEFGVIGILLLFYYLRKVFQSYFFLRKRAGNNSLLENTPAWLILSHSIIVVSFIEIFVRGFGYFSPGVFLLLLSLYMIRKGRY